MKSGAIVLAEVGNTGRNDGAMRIRSEPDIRFLVFGKEPKPSTFASLVQTVGYPNLLLSPDEKTLAYRVAAGCPTKHLIVRAVPENVTLDQ